MPNYAIKIENLAKTYKLYKHPSEVLKETIFRKKYHQEFKALDDINFEILKGEVVGIIGRNGSGKSTLLKIIAGTLDKTYGEVKINGKVSAILDLGLGFNPEYTGRENIYNGAMILGMSKREVDKKINDIIEFSELGDFIDRPFKTYSAGMQSRLTFSVATAIEPEILIIDEALAAGDMFFVTKCMQRMTQMCRSGATVLFVSHSIHLVQKLCNRAIYLEKGRIVKDGFAFDVCQAYERSVMHEVSDKIKEENTQEEPQKKLKRGPIDITNVQIMDLKNKENYSLYQNDVLTLRVHYKADKALKNLGIWALISRDDGVYVTNYLSTEPYQNLGEFKNTGFIDLHWKPVLLGEGNFLVSCGIYPYKKKQPVSAIQANSYVIHDKCYQFQIKRKGWPMQTVFDQPVEIKHYPNGRPSLNK